MVHLYSPKLACPAIGAGQVLVRIKASGVNPLDTKIRSGKAEHARVALPAILGMDLAGVVEAVGPWVTAFKPGDEVYGMAGGIGGVPGTLGSTGAFRLSGINDFVKEPYPALGLVDPVFKQTRRGDIAVLVADFVSGAQVLDQFLVVGEQSAEHGGCR